MQKNIEKYNTLDDNGSMHSINTIDVYTNISERDCREQYLCAHWTAANPRPRATVPALVVYRPFIIHSGIKNKYEQIYLRIYLGPS